MAQMQPEEPIFFLNPRNQRVLTGGKPIPPRKSFDWSGLVSFGLFMLFVIPGVIVALSAGRMAYTYILLQNQETTHGEFIGRRIVSDDDGDSYYVTFRYRIGEQIFTVEDAVSPKIYDTASNGEPLTVLYAPSNPGVAQLDRDSIVSVVALSLFCLFWNGFILYFSFLAAQDWVHTQLYRRRQKGQLLYGTLQSIKIQPDLDGRDMLKVSYEFITPKGRLIEKQHRQKPHSAMQFLPEKEMPVAVWYFNDNRHYLL